MQKQMENQKMRRELRQTAIAAPGSGEEEIGAPQLHS